MDLPPLVMKKSGICHELIINIIAGGGQLDLPPLVMAVPLAVLVDVQKKGDLSVVDQQNVHLGKERPNVVFCGSLGTLLGQPPEATQSSFPMVMYLDVTPDNVNDSSWGRHLFRQNVTS